ncbi:hypothetical protein CONLIGDRAFT_320013 [Coniochaeta ligniaria NRRL 30616]|uniref:Uncharacterized protein n=1 Tax=Coniochaeta ligniaria NRRL 30616 TaxID=1408157 RepID=A0A1J7IM25_9PEZI|nr:hypothetical protein CONLIGDRAFT_320013 [Coniochaeta ligniaria NRRL 30616]
MRRHRYRYLNIAMMTIAILNIATLNIAVYNSIMHNIRPSVHVTLLQYYNILPSVGHKCCTRGLIQTFPCHVPLTLAHQQRVKSDNQALEQADTLAE